MTATTPPTRRRRWSLRLLWRLPLLLAHVLAGIPLTLICFLPGPGDLPAGGMTLRKRAHRTWSRGLLAIFGIRPQIHGRLPDGAALIVANHISWLDIVLLYALWPMWLVAKAEIRAWPLVGWLAEVAGTLFIRRGSEASRQRVARRMAALLRRGEKVGIFPEGGIPERAGVARFHARLFGPAVRTQSRVVPVAIRYHAGGDLHEEMVFAPGETFVGNLLRLLARPPCSGQLMIGEPLADFSGGRSALARQSHAVVQSFYES